MSSKIFITGPTGCLGHYIFDILVKNPDYQLYLYLRNPQKMMRNLDKYPNVTIIKDDLASIEKWSDLLKQMDYVIHIAAGWGNSETNYDYTKLLFEALDPDQLKKVIYFSTASILGDDNKPAEKVSQIGTCYITSKYQMYQELSKLKIFDKIITLFPTWVLGGDSTHPYSHAMEGIIGLKKWLWLVRFFTFDLSFHFIHGQDIALITDYLLKNDVKQKEFVLGNRLTNITEIIKQICEYFHKKIYFQIKITPEFVKFFAGKKINEWDKYCLDKKIFKYDVVNPKDFDLQPEFETITQILSCLR